MLVQNTNMGDGMARSLPAHGNNALLANGLPSTTSLASSYQVPSVDGRRIQAVPLKLCIKKRPPTIAVVYTMVRSSKRKQTKSQKKYIHDIIVDFQKEARSGRYFDKEPEKFTEHICDANSDYLNTAIISQQQVRELLGKLYNTLEIKPKAPEPEKPAASAAAVGQTKAEVEKDSDNISDQYEDDWDNSDDGLDWGDKKKVEPIKAALGSAKPKESDKDEQARDAEERRQKMYFGMDDDDKNKNSNDLLDDIPSINEVKVGGDASAAMQNNFKIDQEDAFNKVVGGADKGGLLASAGISKEETRKAAEKGVEDEDEYGTEESEGMDKNERTNAAGKDAKVNLSGTQQSGLSSELRGISPEEAESIDKQFKILYEQDGELRKALQGSDMNSIGIAEKFQIIEAYMSEGGAAGLQFEQVEEEDEEVSQLMQMQNALEGMSEEEKKALNEQFDALYENDEELQSMVENPAELNFLQKYQILQQFMQVEGDESRISGSQVNRSDMLSGSGEEGEVIVHNGKTYRRVQIEGSDQDFLMDEKQNIYDLKMNKIGEAGDSDEEGEDKF